MKLPVFAFVLGLGAAPLFAADANANSDLTDPKNRISYALGANFGSNLKKEDVEVNMEIVRKGIEDALAGKPQLSDVEMRDTFNQLRAQMQTRRQAKAIANKEAGEKWLAENAKKPGISSTPSGLQYKIISQGTGETPKATDRVSVKYTGKLIDGTVFDSTDNSNPPGQPRSFSVSGVIKGWSEALQLMRKGAKWEIYIPSEIGYGDRGSGNVIPPNSVLIFDVELLDIQAPTPPPVPGGAQQPVTSDIIKVPSAEEMQKGAKIEILKPEDVEKEIAKEKARKDAEKK